MDQKNIVDDDVFFYIYITGGVVTEDPMSRRVVNLDAGVSV